MADKHATKAITVQTLAEEAGRWFESAKRANGDDFYRRKDGAPQWIQDLVMDAHGDMMPDDWRYAFVVEALSALEESDDPDDIALEADVYTSDLTSWAHSRADRIGYCDEAAEEGMISADADMSDRLMAGQYREKEEVLNLVRAFLESRAEELEAEREEAEAAASAEDEAAQPSGDEYELS